MSTPASPPRRPAPLRGGHWTSALPPRVVLGFVLAIVAVLFIASLSYLAVHSRNVSRDRLTGSLQVQREIEVLLSLLKDAETGQRGFLLTGEERYLAPYDKAVSELPRTFEALRAEVIDSPAQAKHLEVASAAAKDKMAELAETIRLMRAGGGDAALRVVRSDIGRQFMDTIRAELAGMAGEEQLRLVALQDEVQRAALVSAIVTWAGAAVLLTLIAVAARMTSASFAVSEQEKWLRAGQLGLNSSINAEQQLETLGDNVVGFLASYLDAVVGAVFATNGAQLECIGAYGAERQQLQRRLGSEGPGLLAEAMRQRRALHVRQVPAGYLPVSSSLGDAAAHELLVAPAIVDGELQAVIELGFFRPLTPIDLDLLDRLSLALAVAIRSSRDRGRLQRLLEETQRQGEELQQQQEELRVTNEELEEQARALKESQVRLETQHAELEQVNSVLEEQAQELEGQRDSLGRAEQVMADKAQELERSNQYKSEFLANMSHELRTPLNSTLIFAKLLAANKKGNLDAEQVNFAAAIGSAGEDLLKLINDILDLSAIEAGKVELDPETIPIAPMLQSLLKGFAAAAEQKGLRLTTTLEPTAPPTFVTDNRRLGQILKNLLSNALKFTRKGEIALTVSAVGVDALAFTVRDTGIGIAPEFQAQVFDAFKQGDGGTARQFGGTGLGLSIARDLAALLGGRISLQSTPDVGSVFTLVLPLQMPAAALTPIAAPRGMPSSAARQRFAAVPNITALAGEQALAATSLKDDRDQDDRNARRILVIEDDERFAAVLLDLAHELGFSCIVTHTGGDGLAAAERYPPSAIVLDVHLPDHTGLSVLDQLKRNPATRHIPVHIVSVEDYSQQALQLGAVGYGLKPVRREELIEAFQRMEAKFAPGARRVLVVEDDPRQREGLVQLLRNDDTAIVAVESAKLAIEQLGSSTFDCMVIDLNLPDLSGYELLETMARQEEVSFPPVIVYTGRVLSQDEEQNLRRYSKSIIIKDARSPERLLDEVTLFLHQVEARLPQDQQRLLKVARDRDALLDGRTILIAEDDVRNVFALSAVLEPKGVKLQIARNGREAVEALIRNAEGSKAAIDLVLMDIMMPEMDGLTAMREIRKLGHFRKLPIIALTAKAMKDDQEKCLAAGANDYIAKPLDPDQLLSLIRVWLPR